MKTACVITVLLASISYALPTEIKRTPILGLLEDKPNSIGKDPVSMIKALPDHNIDPSPLGVDNIVSGLGLPNLNLKRGLTGLDGLVGMSGLNRNNPLGPAVNERPGDVMPVLNSFVPLDQMGSPIAPSAGHKGQIVEDVPVAGEMVNGIPMEPLEGLLDSIGVGGIVKRMKKRSRKHLERQWSGAEELNDHNDEPYFG